MGLFGPGWKSRNEKRAFSCVQKEEDEFELMNIAHFAPIPKIRHYAASKIKNVWNMILLYWQPKSDTSINDDLEKRLHNHPDLVSVVLEAEDPVFRDVALLMMDDKTMLLEVTQRSCDIETVKEAVRKLHAMYPDG